MTTAIEEGFEFVKMLSGGFAVFRDTNYVPHGRLEVWQAHDNRHASYGFYWNGHYWEFCREYKEIK